MGSARLGSSWRARKSLWGVGAEREDWRNWLDIFGVRKGDGPEKKWARDVLLDY